ncbi:MAG TPA: phosphoribosylglycinamide formyltransferase [Cyclobacteriaceae bacterium]|nr:phosphoribosylglycinamide formyltransferase [Cyclobacteriaceae bacterium]
MQDARIAILASGSGTNAEAIIRYFRDHPSISVAAVLSNKPDAFVLERARSHGVPTLVFNRHEFYHTTHVADKLRDMNISHLVLAGFLWLVPENLLEMFPSRILNIHPALLPAYGGKGMYGMRVHEAVKSSGDTQTGITIHEVTPAYDDGPVIFQATCAVDEKDSPEAIAEKVHRLEHYHYPRVIEKWINNH